MRRISRYLSRWKTRFSFPSIYLFGGWGRRQVMGKVLCLESWFFFYPPVLHSGFLSEAFKSNLELDANESLYTTSQFTEHLHVFPVSAFIFAVGIWVDCRVWAKLSWLESRGESATWKMKDAPRISVKANSFFLLSNMEDIFPRLNIKKVYIFRRKYYLIKT